MAIYQGETEIDWKSHPNFKDMTQQDWALLYIEMYGGIDGAHHKDWVLDQIARILTDAPITVKMATWDNGQSEYRYRVGESEKYHEWVKKITHDEDGEEIAEYNEGIAP